MDTDTCPVCGEPNQCGIAQGMSHCWCFEAPLPEHALAASADQDALTRCLCQRCLEAARTTSPEPSTES
jgi:hypothetical protein